MSLLLPSRPEAIAVISDLLPPRPQEHNSSRFRQAMVQDAGRWFQYVAKPPSYPPPHVKDSQHVGPIRPLPPSSASGSASPTSVVPALRGLPSLNVPDATSAKSGATNKAVGTSRPKEPVDVKAPPKATPIVFSLLLLHGTGCLRKACSLICSRCRPSDVADAFTLVCLGFMVFAYIGGLLSSCLSVCSQYHFVSLIRLATLHCLICLLVRSPVRGFVD